MIYVCKSNTQLFLWLLKRIQRKEASLEPKNMHNLHAKVQRPHRQSSFPSSSFTSNPPIWVSLRKLRLACENPIIESERFCIVVDDSCCSDSEHELFLRTWYREAGYTHTVVMMVSLPNGNFHSTIECYATHIRLRHAHVRLSAKKGAEDVFPLAKYIVRSKALLFSNWWEGKSI